MPSPAERFIAAATAPLADNAELQMTAEEELRSPLVVGDASGAQIAATAELLELSRPTRRLRLWLYLTTALLSLVAFAAIAVNQARYRMLLMSSSYALDFSANCGGGLHLHGPAVLPLERLPGILGDFTAEEKQLIFGNLDSGKLFTPDQFETPDPEKPEPARVAEYLRAMAICRALTPLLPRQASGSDPGNAYYQLLTAQALLQTTKALKYENRGPKKPSYTIVDPAALAETLKLLDDAAAQPRFDSYTGELMARRLAILPPGDDYPGRLLAQRFIHDWYPASSFLGVSSAVRVQAYELAAAGDAAGYRKLCATWERVLRMILADERSLPEDALQAGRAMASTAFDLSRAAKTLKLDADAARYLKIHRALQQREGRYTDWISGQGEELRKRCGKLCSRFESDRSNTLVPVTPDDAALKPGRLAEHAFAARFIACAQWLLALVAVLIMTLCRFRHGLQARRLSLSLARVIGVKEQLRIIGWGVLAPLVLILMLEHFTPLGGRSWGWRYSDTAGLYRAAAMMILVLALPCWIASRKLQTRYAFLGWKLQPAYWLGICASAAVAWLGGGLLAWLGTPEDHDARELIGDGMQILLIVPGLPLILSPLAILLGPRHRALGSMAVCHAVAPAYACAMLAFAALTFFHHAEERYWIQRDTLTKPEPGIPAWTRFDFELAQQARSELLEILEAKP